MKKRKAEKEAWETPSLEWIHHVRRERQIRRAGQPIHLLSRAQAEKLATRWGLKLARPSVAAR